MNRSSVLLFGILFIVCSGCVQSESGCTSCQGETTSSVANNDPHYFNVCSNGEQKLMKCPPLTLFVMGAIDVTKCLAGYGGCSKKVAGCVPCQYFPWPKTDTVPTAPVVPASMTRPACTSVGPAAPYCDPSYYWYCKSIYGLAELRACPPGYGFSTRRIVGCTTWYNWNTGTEDSE